MDGRAQEPIINFIKEEYNVLFVDMITKAGPVKMLSDPSRNNIETIISCIEISLEKHKSRGIAIVAHHDCAGNPISDEKTEKVTKTSSHLSCKQICKTFQCVGCG